MTFIYQIATNLTQYQGGVHCTGIKSFDNLPPTIKSLDLDMKIFKPALREYLFLLCTWFYLHQQILIFIHIYMWNMIFLYFF
jgi:hypothetical protein